MINFLIDNVPQSIKTFNFTSSIDSLADGYSVTIIDQVDYNVDSVVKIFYNQKLIFTGYIDTIEIDQSLSSVDTRMTGRSKVADIIDSTINGSLVHNNISFFNLCQELLKGFNIKVINKNPAALRPIANVSFSIGDKIFDSLAKYAKDLKLYLTCNEFGDLVIDSFFTSIVGNYTDVDFKNIKYKLDNSELFSEYVIHAQTDNQQINVRERFKQRGIYRNNGIRKRTFRKQSEDKLVSRELNNLARYEHEIRMTRSEVIEISELPSFVDKNNNLFLPNRLIILNLATFNIRFEYRITSVSYNFSLGNGEKTNLNIARKDSYDLKSTKPIKDSMTSFGTAFRTARNAGRDTFYWRGNEYHTRLAEEV